MQSTGTLLSLPGLSRSNLAISCTSTSASLVRTQENRDDLESYLSILAGKGDGGGGKRKKEKAVVDWGKLLDGQGDELQSSREEGEGDSDEIWEPGDGDVTALFMKPQSQQNTEHSKKSTVTETTNSGPGFKKLSSQPHTQKDPIGGKFGLNTSLVGSQMDIDLVDSMTLTDTTTESGSDDDLIGTNLFSDIRARNGKLTTTKSTRSFSHEHCQAGESSKKQLGSGSLETSRESVEQETSDLSLSQNLSRHFRNNIFTLDQLETVDTASISSEPDENATLCSTAQATAERMLVKSDSPVEVSRLYEIRSLAELESLPAESKTELQNTVEEQALALVEHGPETEEDRDQGSHSFDGRDLDHQHGEAVAEHDKERSTCSIQDSAVVSYEEDFDSETVRSDGFTHTSRDEVPSLQAQAGDRPDDSVSDDGSGSGEEYSSQWEQTYTASTSYPPPQSHRESAEHFKVVHTNKVPVTAKSDGVSGDSSAHGGGAGAKSEESDLRKYSQPLITGVRCMYMYIVYTRNCALMLNTIFN